MRVGWTKFEGVEELQVGIIVFLESVGASWKKETGSVGGAKEGWRCCLVGYRSGLEKGYVVRVEEESL